MNAKGQPVGLAFLFSADALKVNFHKQTKEIKMRCAAAAFALSKWERRDQWS
jgi:hypothetical protein